MSGRFHCRASGEVLARGWNLRSDLATAGVFYCSSSRMSGVDPSLPGPSPAVLPWVRGSLASRCGGSTIEMRRAGSTGGSSRLVTSHVCRTPITYHHERARSRDGLDHRWSGRRPSGDPDHPGWAAGSCVPDPDGQRTQAPAPPRRGLPASAATRCLTIQHRGRPSSRARFCSVRPAEDPTNGR